jgi:NADPH-dependent glutamate synthase beta subunit-like oxidoreductase/dihydroorotate dehydrogenase
MKNTYVFEPFSIGDVHFRNPFYVASGPTTRNLKQLMRAEECGWGAASIKLTIAPEPYINREPRYGWFANQGIFSFTAEKRLTPDQGLKLVEEARKNTSDLVIMANITYAGEEDIKEGWGRLAKQFEDAGAHIIELNMCCPNMSYNVELSGKCDISGPKTGASLGQNEEAVSHITQVVKESVSIPVFVKLTPEGGRISQVSRASFEAGADAVGGAGNRMAIPPFDIYHPGSSPYALQKELSFSCFAGEWVKPLALRDVYEIRKLVGKGPIITATGGIRNFRDVVEMTFMGANLYGICAETILSGFDFLKDIIRELRIYLDEMGYDSLGDFRGAVVDDLKSAKNVTLQKGHAQVKDRMLSAPCVVSCPNHVPAQGYVMAVAKGNLRKAYDLITSSSPLQFICGYACNHPCETSCIRANIDEAVRIREIKRFILEYGKMKGWTPNLNLAPKNGKQVAVIGAGPAGLSAAFYLQLAGYEVTIFEKETESGGLLRYGIPTYRLPKKVLDYEIDLIRLLGIHIKYACQYPKDINIAQLKKDGFEAIILAIGAQKSIPLNVAGESSNGYITALEFLGNYHKGKVQSIGKRVVVIGGGFSAVDAARTCIRMGAEEVFIAYRRTRDEMPASPEEIKEAEEEGIKIMYLVSPKEILKKEGKISGIRLVNYVLGETDTSNRRKPLEVEGTEFSLRADTIISALGQKTEKFSDEEYSNITHNGLIEVDPDTFKTKLENVYAIGDAALGASDIISAIASGKRVAAALDSNLSGETAVIKPVIRPNQVERDRVLENKGNAKRGTSEKNYTIEAADRIKNFEIYTRPFTEEEAIREASRCLNCGCGEGCMLCVDLCNSFAISNDRGKPLVDTEECVGCGICVWRCPNDNLEMIEID